MVPYFTRLKFAFRTFFSILDHGRIPSDVAAALGMAAPEAGALEAAPVQRAPADENARATQMLAILQRDGRLIDFLMEDISPYADAQIGAAARDVHTGAREALLRYLTLTPVLDSEEGGTVSVEPGTDAATVKIIGNVPGQPPFRGVLRHRGWRVSRIELPPLSSTGRSVVAPAEIEVP